MSRRRAEKRARPDVLDGRQRGWKEKAGSQKWYLRKIPLLSRLSDKELDIFREGVTIWEVPKRSVVYLPGDPASSFFVVNGGRLKLSRVTDDGREITLRYVRALDVFGEESVFFREPRREMVEAMEPSLITEIPVTVFLRMLEEHPELYRDLVTLEIRKRQSLEERLEELVFVDVRAKLAGLLLDLVEDYGEKLPDGGIRIRLRITHQEIASYIGSTRETVSLTLSHFRRAGVLDTERRQLIILQPDELRRLL